MKLQIQKLKGESNSITEMCNKLYLSQFVHSDVYKGTYQAVSCLSLRKKHIQPLLKNYDLVEDETDTTYQVTKTGHGSFELLSSGVRLFKQTLGNRWSIISIHHLH
jgi:hypothetical protein